MAEQGVPPRTGRHPSTHSTGVTVLSTCALSGADQDIGYTYRSSWLGQPVKRSLLYSVRLEPIRTGIAGSASASLRWIRKYCSFFASTSSVADAASSAASTSGSEKRVTFW